MATNYPGSLDSWSDPISTTTMDQSGYEHDLVHTNELDAITAIETELGTSPSGAFATVAGKLQQSAFFAGYADLSEVWPGPRYMTTWAINSAGSPASQDVVFSRWYCPESFTATKLWWLQNAAGSGITSASMGIFDSSGTLLQSASIASVVTSTGLKSVTITGQAVTKGSVYYLGWTVNGTPGSVAAVAGQANNLAVAGASASDRPGYIQNSQASLPSSVTYSGLSTDARIYAFGVST